MNKRPQTIRLTSAAAAMLVFATFASAQYGVYKEADTEDTGVRLAADFAVKERSAKTKAKIELGEIVKAEDQETKNGTNRNFRLCLTVTKNDRPSSARAIVSMDAYSNLKLVSWTATSCGRAAGDGFAQVENTHSGVRLAADFAVKEHSEDTKIEHTLVKILKGEIKGKFDLTYRVCMQVAEKEETIIVQAIVSMDQYSNMKLVRWQHSNCDK